MTQQTTPIVDDLVIVGANADPRRRTGRVIKVLEPKAPSPGGYVVDNDASTFYVAPWEKITVGLRAGMK